MRQYTEQTLSYNVPSPTCHGLLNAVGKNVSSVVKLVPASETPTAMATQIKRKQSGQTGHVCFKLNAASGTPSQLLQVCTMPWAMHAAVQSDCSSVA